MHILCATDFSKPATDAASVAAAMAKRLNLPLRLVHCAQDWIVMGDLPAMLPDDQPARDELTREAERLRAGGIVVVEEMRRGIASLEIIAAASSQPTKLIVLGSFGKGMADRWLIGSVTERVAEGATVPTLVIRQPQPLLSWLNGDAPLRLLCGVDFTAAADAAIAALQTFVAVGRVDVGAAYVRPTDDPVGFKRPQAALERDVRERLHSVLGEAPVDVHIREVVGQPAAEFLHTAEEQGSALLVVGTHQRHGWQRLKAPSFSRSVVAHALVNVLCVPAARGETAARLPIIRRVLVATNFTEVCTEALRQAYSLLPSGGDLHLVHVCHEPAGSINPIIASEMYFDHSLATAKAKVEAEEKLQTLASLPAAAPGVALTFEALVHHNVAAAICAAAASFGADVICMGTKGHSRTGVALLGSTLQRVLAQAHKPIFAVTAPPS